jgi:hypothetical protein
VDEKGVDHQVYEIYLFFRVICAHAGPVFAPRADAFDVLRTIFAVPSSLRTTYLPTLLTPELPDLKGPADLATPREAEMNGAQVVSRTLVLTMLLGLAVIGSNRAESAMLAHVSAAAFGTFKGVDYLLNSGRFVGETLKGTYRMPFEIVASDDHPVIVTHEE